MPEILPFTNPLLHIHEQAEAAFLPYADQSIVETYGSVELEYTTLRKSAGLMDSSHRSLLQLTGKDRLPFLHRLLTNDLLKLKPGSGAYAFFLHRTGKILFDLNVIHQEDRTLLEVDIRHRADLLQELERYLFADDVQCTDLTYQQGHLSLIGPQAATLLDTLLETSIAHTLIAPFSSALATLSSIPITLFRQDLTGESGYEILVPRAQLVTLWQLLLKSNSAPHPLRPIGWAAFNMARIETGTPLFGIDFTDTSLPLETGPNYARAVSLTKGCYPGQEIVARMHTRQSVSKKIVGLRIKGDLLPTAGTAIFVNDSQVGMITSSCISPMLSAAPITLGTLKTEVATPDQELTTFAESQRVTAQVVPLPFWVKTP